jgi:signal transduction histidine kinase
MRSAVSAEHAVPVGRSTTLSQDRPSARTTARIVAYALLFAVAYDLFVRLGLGFRFQNSQIGVVWPANALLVSALLLTSRSRWWIVLVAAAIPHALEMNATVPEWRWAWQIAGNSVFAMATVYVLDRAAGMPLNFGSRRQVLAYAVVSFGMPALYGVTTPAFVRSVMGLESAYTPAAAVLRTTLSTATGMLVLGPFILKWAQYGVERMSQLSWSRAVEGLVMLVTVLTVGIAIFGTGPNIARVPTLLLFAFPPLLWAAVRFGPIGGSTTLLAVAALSIWGTARRLGPFVLIDDTDRILSLEVFWIVLWGPTMLLAATIRERERAEKALQQQRNQLAHVTRVATVGELSGAIAHELRQPLTSILVNAQTGQHLLSSPEVDLAAVREILDEIAGQDKQAANVITRMRSFIQKGDSRFQSIALESVVRDALALGRLTAADSGVEIQTEMAPGLPSVNGDPVELLQVVLNLIVNACESMKHVARPRRHLVLRIGRRTLHEVEVVVSDAGLGLPTGSSNRVFEPFYTTKQNGLGLGLAISRTIATAHGGRLWGENNEDGGATFRLVLPAEGTSFLTRQATPLAVEGSS